MVDPVEGAAHVGSKVGGKIAGLPTPIVIGGGLGVVYLLYKHMKNANAAATVTPLTSNIDPVTGLPRDPFSAVGTGGWSSTPDPLAGTTGNGITDNTQWQTAAGAWLIQQGYDPTLSAKAVGDYVAGNPLPPSEQVLVNVAIGKFGPKPNPGLPGPTPPPVDGKNAPIDYAAKIQPGQKGSVYDPLTQFYGSNNGFVYQHVEGPTVPELEKAGIPIYIQPIPGTFVPWSPALQKTITNTNLPLGKTPIYIRTSKTGG